MSPKIITVGQVMASQRTALQDKISNSMDIDLWLDGYWLMTGHYLQDWMLIFTFGDWKIFMLISELIFIKHKISNQKVSIMYYYHTKGQFQMNDQSVCNDFCVHLLFTRFPMSSCILFFLLFSLFICTFIIFLVYISLFNIYWFVQFIVSECMLHQSIN